jgi:hypothetical protein
LVLFANNVENIPKKKTKNAVLLAIDSDSDDNGGRGNETRGEG